MTSWNSFKLSGPVRPQPLLLAGVVEPRPPASEESDGPGRVRPWAAGQRRPLATRVFRIESICISPIRNASAEVWTE